MLKTTRPSSSYELDLPADSCEQFDSSIASFWIDGNPLLLQLSSYVRKSDEQIGARARLDERIARTGADWKIWDVRIHPSTTLDQASAEFTDQEGLVWVHSYFVWPHLAVYATVSGPAREIGIKENWAIKALQSVRLVLH